MDGIAFPARDGQERSASSLPTTPGRPLTIREEPDLQAAPEQATADDAFPALLRFHLTGEQDAPDNALSEQCLLPAPLHAYRDFSRIRSDYPFCIPEDDASLRPLPLTQIIEEITGDVAGEGDEGERFKRSLWKLEAEIRALVDQGATGRLTDLWNQAAAALADRQKNARKSESFNEQMTAAREALTLDGPLLGCTPPSVASLLDATGQAQRASQTGTFRESVATLIQELSDILAVDLSHSPEAMEPGNLQDAVGTTYAEEINFETLAHLLEKAPHGEALSQERRSRIQAARRTLVELTPLFTAEDTAETGSLFDNRVTSCKEALDRMQARLEALTSFFRAYHTARLEATNKYQAARHDPLFDRYTLAPDEQALCPPLLVYLDGDRIDATENALLFELLSTGLPFKVLVSIGNLGGDNSPTGLVWRTRLASMALALNTAYVLQTTASHLQHLATGFEEGVSFSGPALFCVYTGATTDAPHLHPYLRSAIAPDARAFPAFTYNPGQGPTWAARFSIEATPQFEQDWPVSSITYENADGEEATLEVPFTFVDFMACDARFAEHFMWVPRAAWQRGMVSLDAYRHLDEAERSDKVPYILMVAQDGTLYRVVVTRKLVQATARVEDHWHSLQELGGVNNSHARRLLEQEAERLETEKQQAVAQVEEIYQAELDKTTGELAREIVSNIAAGLLQLPTAGPLPTATAPPPGVGIVEETSTPDAPPAETVPEEALEPEEEELSFDEAYIETPRCTACNECTTINSLMFAYNGDKQAYFKDLSAGTYREIVMAAEKCPVDIIHPGKPLNPDEPGLEDLLKRAEPYL